MTHATLQALITAVGAQSITSDSQNFVAGRHYWALVNQQDFDEATNQPAGSGTGTWTGLQNQIYGANFARFSVYHWLCDGNATGTVTFTVSGNTLGKLHLVILESTPSAGKIFSGASVVQSAKDLGESTSPSVTLAAFADAGNTAMGAFANGYDAIAMTVGSGFTEIQSDEAENHGILSEYKSSSDTGVDASSGATTVNWAAIGWELAEFADTDRSASDGIKAGEDIATVTVQTFGGDGVDFGDGATYPASDPERAAGDGIKSGDSSVGRFAEAAAVSDGAKFGEDMETAWTTDSGPDGIKAGDSAVGDYIEIQDEVDDGALFGDQSVGFTENDRANVDGVSFADALAVTLAWLAGGSDGARFGDGATYPGSGTIPSLGLLHRSRMWGD